MTPGRINYNQEGIYCYLLCLGYDSAASTSRLLSVLGGNFVVNATVRGNLTRFNNHSCSPNFKMDEILHGSLVFLVILACHRISRGDELKYNYIMTRCKVDRAPCKFCTAQCHGFMD